jgi:hypothetical protein
MSKFVIKKFELDVTKSGNPAFWENGGFNGKSGVAVIIADSSMKKKKCLFVNRNKDKNGKHALFTVTKGDVIVVNNYIKENDYVGMYSIKEFHETEGKLYALCKMIWTYTGTEWSTPTTEVQNIPRSNIISLIEACRLKARSHECTSMSYGTK